MKIYIAGRILGQPNLNRGAFADASVLITQAGHAPINPHDICIDPANPACLRKCITELIQCEAVVTLDGWEKSEIATLEVKIAQALGIKIVPLPAVRLLKTNTFEPVFGC